MINMLTQDTYEQEVMKAEGTVLVDFYADWCGPCKMMHPVLEDIDATNDKGLKVAQINVDEYPDIAGAYGVQSIPNLILFKDGKAVNQAIGFMNKDQLLAKIGADLD